MMVEDSERGHGVSGEEVEEKPLPAFVGFQITNDLRKDH